MVTGSHIPFDRNGYKTNTSRGELLKQHEAPIGEAVEQVRQQIYGQPFSQSLFNVDGQFKSGHTELPPVSDVARSAYINRYVRFFNGQSLKGRRLLFYQHSAVGRDLVVEILKQLGAEVIPSGRSEVFVPIDTENIDSEQLNTIQSLVDRAAADLAAVRALGGRLLVPEDPAWPAAAMVSFDQPGLQGHADWVAPLGLWVRGPGALAEHVDGALEQLQLAAATSGDEGICGQSSSKDAAMAS